MFTKECSCAFPAWIKTAEIFFNYDQLCQGKGPFKSCICFLVLMLTVSAAVTACCYEYIYIYICIHQYFLSMHIDAF